MNITDDAIANAVRRAISSLAEGMEVHDVRVVAELKESIRDHPFQTFSLPERRRIKWYVELETTLP